LLQWARGLDGERVWALEDCRHVSGSLERFLIGRGERVLRIPTHLTAKARRSARRRGKSDAIDALNVARAALQEGLESFPAAQLDGPELDLRLLVDHRERLVRQRVELNSTLLWHLHDLWPGLRLPGGALFSKKWSTRIARRLARAQQTTRVRIARDELRRVRELTLAINQLECEITELVEQLAPQLLAEPGFGPLIAAKLVGEIAGAQRFATPAKLARAAGVAPIPARLRQHAAPPARPGRQPPDQRRAAPRDRHPRPLSLADTRVHRAPALRRQEHPRSDPLPQAPPRPPRLATPPTARPGQNNHTHQSLDIEATHAIARAISRQLSQSLVAMAPGPASDCWSSSNPAASGRAKRCARTAHFAKKQERSWS
jgi:transposase